MAVPLRSDFDAVSVRSCAKSKDGPQVRRLLALAAIYDGASRTEAAKIGGVTLQIVRDWVVKFNAHGPAGLIDRKAPGSRRVSTTRTEPPSLRSSRAARSRPCMGSCGGGTSDRRSLPMDFRGVPRRRLPANAEPGTARDGLSQAVGSSPASRASGWRD